jgi:uracil-DNA glycosylase
VVLVGEARGEAEARLRSSFVGPSGVELLRMLDKAQLLVLSAADRQRLDRYYQTRDPALVEVIWGFHQGKVMRTNVFQLHPPGNDLQWFCGPKAVALAGYPALSGGSKYVRDEFEPELDRLASEVMAADPNLIICLGNTALWAFTGKTTITKFRGTTMLSTYTAVGFKVLPTFHPAAIMRQWKNRPTVIADLMKAKHEATFPEVQRPHREAWIEPSLEDISSFVKDRARGCRLLSVDIETSGQRITCIGFAPDAGIGIVIPFDDPRQKGGSYWPSAACEVECWKIVRSVLEDASIPKLFQNGLYDIAFLWRGYGVKTMGAQEDTMLLSHALQPEGLKGLGYLGSVFSDEGAWKNMHSHRATIKRDD